MTLPYEATHSALTGHRKSVALALGISDSTVEAHCVRPKDFDGQGLASPAQRVIETILTLKRDGADDPYALLRYIARECGGTFELIEPASDPADLDRVAEVVREFGEFLGAVSEASADGILSAPDSERIVIEGEHVIAAMRPMIRAHYRNVTDCEYAAERQRRGPKRAMPRLMDLRRLA